MWSNPFHHTWHVSHPLQASRWCPYFWHLKHLRRYWDILFTSLADLYLLGSIGQIKSQDVGVGLDLFFTFSSGDSSYVCHSLFFQGYCNLCCCSQGQLPTSDNSLRRVQSFVGICSSFCSVEAFHFEDVLGLLPTVDLDKQVFISCFLHVLVGSSRRDNFFFEQSWEFYQVDILQKFDENKSGEINCLILRIWFE